jgi:hypothetical protein
VLCCQFIIISIIDVTPAAQLMMQTNLVWIGLCVCQDEVLIDVEIRKPSLYRIIYRYINPTANPVTADVTVTPESSASELPQSGRVVFAPTRQPQFVTVSAGVILTTFVLNPGLWTFSLKTPAGVYVVSRRIVYDSVCFFNYVIIAHVFVAVNFICIWMSLSTLLAIRSQAFHHWVRSLSLLCPSFSTLFLLVHDRITFLSLLYLVLFFYTLHLLG